MMKKVLILFITSCVILVGCKKNNTTNNGIVSEQDNEITISSNPGLFTKGDLATEFVTGSKIGVYSIESSFPNFGTDMSKVKQANVGYLYNSELNLWSVMPSIKPLQWQFDVSSFEIPVELIAYSPYNASHALAADKINMPFEVAEVQNTNEEVQVNDLLWARSTGKINATDYENVKPGASAVYGRGLKKSTDKGKNIKLEFNHTLSSVKMHVSFVKKLENGETIEDVKLTEIVISGPSVSRHGVLNMLNGVYAPTANAADVVGSIKWNAGFDVTNFIADGTADWATNKSYYNYVCDLVVQPQVFDAAQKNTIEFFIQYKYNTGQPGAIDETVIKSYKYMLGEAALPQFEINTIHNVYAYMTVSSNEIRVFTSIVPWLTKEHFIPAE